MRDVVQEASCPVISAQVSVTATTSLCHNAGGSTLAGTESDNNAVESAMLALLVLLAATAEVVDGSAAGFTSRNTVRVDASANTAYRALVENVDQWWDPAHTYSGDLKNLSLNATAGGCFCETLPDGGSVEHMRVVYVEPGTTLRLQGALGPLQSIGVAGAMTFDFEASGDATQITLTYSAGGYYPGGLDTLAEPVDGVLRGQLERLAALAETP